MRRDLKQLEAKLDIRFQQHRLLIQAFTHSSYVNEQRNSRTQHNERLEFLGDAVLELATSEYLFHRFPNRSEGELTKMRAAIVCEPSLVAFAEELEFGSYIFLGKGEEMTGGRMRPALLADVFEAFVGALYLDQGWEVVKQFLSDSVFGKISANEGKFQATDYKTTLQEYIQHHNLGVLEYRIADERGPAHDKQFVSEVYMDDKPIGRGTGKSKKESEQQAAADALRKLKVQLK